MNHISQKDLFLNGEADEWFNRNSNTVSDPSRSDFLLPYLKSLPLKPHSETKVLEIGCGHGTRLLTLSNSFEWTVTGIDPSQNAVERLTKEGINCLRATADNLPFDDHSFDLVIFGFAFTYVIPTIYSALLLKHTVY